MKNLLFLFFLFFSLSAEAAAPTRPESYSANDTILSAEVNNDLNTLYNYLQAGVDTFSDNTIVNADISSSAAIQSDKLTLTSVNQNMAMSSSIFTFAKGADVASTASMTLGTDGNFFDITGTTGITSITAKTAGTVVILQFDSSLTVTDGSNLNLAGDFSATANDILILISNGTDYFEISRSNN